MPKGVSKTGARKDVVQPKGANGLGPPPTAGAPPTAAQSAASEEVRATELKRFSKLTQQQQLGELRGMPPNRRAELLAQLPSTDRMLMLGSSAVKGDVHETGPTFEPPWAQLPLKRGYNANDAWAMSVAAKRAYEPFSSDGRAANTESVKDLIAQGYDVKLLGASNPSSQGYLAVKGDKAIVAFRGTEPQNSTDWATDASFRQIDGYGGRVHAGFENGMNQIWGELERELAAAQRKLPSGQKLSVHVTGHSLGAALATLAADRIDTRLKDMASVEGVYTFGSPRVFDPAAAAAYQRALGDRTFRFQNNDDLVTRVPKINYRHVGTNLYFDHLGNQHVSPSVLFKAEEDVKGMLEDAVEHRLAREGEAEGVWDHGPQGYVKHVYINANSRAVP